MNLWKSGVKNGYFQKELFVIQENTPIFAPDLI